MKTAGNTSLLNGGREFGSAAGVPQIVVGFAQETHGDRRVWPVNGVRAYHDLPTGRLERGLRNTFWKLVCPPSTLIF